MTIACGFICEDGILLASDTLYSGAQNKSYGRKLWPIGCGDIIVCFGGAGLEVSLMRCRNDIERKLRSTMSHDDVVDLISNVIDYVIRRQSPSEALQLLVGIRTPDLCALYQNGGQRFLGPVRKISQCVGWADGLGQYLSERLFNESMTVGAAKVVAAYVIKQAKTYSDYCDGETHLLTLPLVGDPEFTDDHDKISGYEAFLSVFDEALELALPNAKHRPKGPSLSYRRRVLIDAINHARGADERPRVMIVGRVGEQAQIAVGLKDGVPALFVSQTVSGDELSEAANREGKFDIAQHSIRWTLGHVVIPKAKRSPRSTKRGRKSLPPSRE
jgi:hypothetical protein